MFLSHVTIKSFDEFSKFTGNIDPESPPILFYFCGSKLSDGRSWCPDCAAEFIGNLPQKGPDVYFFFSGTKKENGRSWCIYCQMAEPIVKAFLDELKKNIIFVYVDVGDKEHWKDRACPFRTDNRTKLMVIPTIIRWKGVQRLEGSQCTKRDLLRMLFEDD